jgi:hypothetical protein
VRAPTVTVSAPTLTRAATSTLSAVAVFDFLQLGYAAAQQRTAPPETRDPRSTPG